MVLWKAFTELILSENNPVLFSFLKKNLSEIENQNSKKDFSKILIKDYQMSPYILSQ